MLALVDAFVSELGSTPVRGRVALDDVLDRDLGIGSLERVELLARLEEAFDVRFPDGSPVAPAPPVGRREAAELDETRLVGMQRQPELREPLAQLGEELLGLLPRLESHDEVIGEAHDHDVSARLPLSPSLDPEIQHVVQITAVQVQDS